jgi:hypothetical protein
MINMLPAVDRRSARITARGRKKSTEQASSPRLSSLPWRQAGRWPCRRHRPLHRGDELRIHPLEARFSRLTNGCAWNAVSAFANCGRAVALVQDSYVPHPDIHAAFISSDD